jgi:hypothetical protein
VKLITTTDGRRRRKEWVSGESHKERAGTAGQRLSFGFSYAGSCGESSSLGEMLLSSLTAHR